MAQSTARLKSKGDTGSPCCRLQLIGKASERNWPIWWKAFIALHGITDNRLQGLQDSMSLCDLSPINGRGKRNNYNWICDETIAKIIEHVRVCVIVENRTIPQGSNTVVTVFKKYGQENWWS